MRTGSVLMAGMLLLATLVATPARAEDGTRTRAQDVLEGTDRRISLAVTFVAESPNTAAQGELNVAQEGQTRARSAFGSGQYVIAVSASFTAREHADRAIAIVRNLPDPERVQTQVERTRDLLDRARERLDACDNTRARSMLHVALTMQGRAERAMDDSRYLGALQLTMSARERVLKALRLCHLDDSLADGAERALQRTDDVLARAAESFDAGTPQAVRDMLARAASIQAQAHSEARQTRYESALRLTLGARAMAQRALRPGQVLRGAAAR